ncbi:hypothetical protein R1sor_009078 [Riccia sorocarpa]|uniref:Uncharacterized protein n=1 Tax=Riccia sorocarpa TaxID=122646 RepID=A0ABD3H7J7_9MARC
MYMALEVRGHIKDAQYKESQELSLLDEKKKRLSQLGSRGDLSAIQMEEFGIMTEEIRKLEAIQHHKYRLWSREKVLALGDSNTKYFLTKFKRKNAHTSLKSLRRDDGTLLTSQTDITKEVFRFYE